MFCSILRLFVPPTNRLSAASSARPSLLCKVMTNVIHIIKDIYQRYVPMLRSGLGWDISRYSIGSNVPTLTIKGTLLYNSYCDLIFEIVPLMVKRKREGILEGSHSGRFTTEVILKHQ